MPAPLKQESSWSELLEMISTDNTVWVRLAAIDHENEWVVHLLDLVAGDAPPSWAPTEWDYSKARFRSCAASATHVLKWFTDGYVRVGDLCAKLPSITDRSMIRWNRRSTAERPMYEALAWPTDEATLPAGFQHQQAPQEPMIATDAPSFITFYTAAAAFFHMQHQVGGGISSPSLTYRYADRTARITHLRVAEEYVETTIESRPGVALALEVAGEHEGPLRQLDVDLRQHVVRLPMPTGLPPGAWVLVKTESRWVDRRFLTYPYARGNEAGVEWVVPAMTRLAPAIHESSDESLPTIV